MATKKKQPTAPPVPCVYGCGRDAEGTLCVSFSEFTKEGEGYSHNRHERGFNCYLACCRECVRGAVRIGVTIPKEAK